jgi:hypothetical protein
MIENAHFFDIDTLINVDSQVWIVSKMKPSIPIMKLTQSEFNLIKKRVYRKHESSLSISGEDYWLPQNLLEELKIKAKNSKVDITDLVFSMQEFMNSTVIENLDYKILDTHFQHLKNKTDDIYVICSKNNKRNYEVIIKKLEDFLFKFGLKVKNYYYLSETFYNRDTDYISHRKVRLLIQHLIGYKTNDDKFIDEEITNYDRVYFYDDEPHSIKMVSDANQIFKFLLDKSDDIISGEIKNIIKEREKVISIRQVTHNKINIFNEKEVILEINHIVKTFENFLLRYKN